jgi:hypothetical protein
LARRIGIAGIVVLAVIGLAVTAVLAWASSPAGAGRLAGELRENLQRQFGVDAYFEEIDLGIFPPRIGISNIRINAPFVGVFCRIQEAEFSPDPLSLLQGVFEIEEIYLGSPDCVAELGQWELDDLLDAGDESRSPAPVPFERLLRFGAIALSEGYFALRIRDPDRLGDWDASMDRLGLDLTGGDAAELRGLVGAVKVRWSDEHVTVNETVESVELRAQISPESIDVRHFDLRAPGLELHLRDAHMQLPTWPKGPEIAFLSAKLDLETFARLPLGLPCMYGKASFEGSGSLSRDDQAKPLVAMKGRVDLAQARVDDFFIGDLMAKFSLSPKGVAVEEARLDAAGGSLFLSGDVAFDDVLSTNLDVRLADIELAELLENLTVTDAYVMQRMSGPAKLAGSLDPFKLSGNVDIDVRDHTVLSDSFRSLSPPVVLHLPRVRVRGAVEVTDKYLTGTGLSVELGATKLAVGLRFVFGSLPTFDISARSEDFHMDDVRSIAGLEFQGHGPLKARVTGVLWEPVITGEFRRVGAQPGSH